MTHALVLTDVVDSTQLAAQLGDARNGELERARAREGPRRRGGAVSHALVLTDVVDSG